MLWWSELSKTLIHLTVDGWGWVPSLLLWRSELSKTLIHLTVDRWGWVPSLLVVLPEATQHWSLPVLFGGVNGRLWEGSCQGELPRTYAASVLIPTVKQSHHPPLQETPQHQQVGLVQSPPGHCSFPWVLMHTLLCVCPPRVGSLFPPVLSKSCNQFPLSFKV